MKLGFGKDDGAQPVIVVTGGNCIFEKCTITRSLGTGILCAVDDVPNDHYILPIAYLKNCDIATGTSIYPGLEVRSFGSAEAVNCEIKNCGRGVGIWNYAKKVTLKNCNIFNNKTEGVLAQQDEIYDNEIELVADNCSVHHNQLGYSLGFVKSVSISNSFIHSNRSWGIALRNATIAYIAGNDISRNECGGIKIMFNRHNQTLISKNRIHHHTGPDIMQTRYFNESEEKMFNDLCNDLNREPVLLLDNVCFNNELEYAGFEDLEIFTNNNCNLCQVSRGIIKCDLCFYTAYCSRNCQKQHFEAHKEFCSYFREEKIFRIELDRYIPGTRIPIQTSPSNETIQNCRKKIPLNNWYYKEECLVKLNEGDNYYGLSEHRTDNLSKILWEGFGGNGSILVYDKCRNIEGVCRHAGLQDVIRKFGKKSMIQHMVNISSLF